MTDQLKTRWTRYGEIWSDGSVSVSNEIMKELLEYCGESAAKTETEYWVLLPAYRRDTMQPCLQEHSEPSSKS